jgi:protocatechuate 3,4-dioxygenase beta subunit
MDRDDVSRRELLRRLSALAAVPALGTLVGCGEEAASQATIPPSGVSGAVAGASGASPATTPAAAPVVPASMPAPAMPPQSSPNIPAAAAPAPAAPPAASAGAAGAGPGAGAAGAGPGAGAAGGAAAPMSGPAIPPPPTMCILSPEETEGPYYVDDAMMRKEIAEDRPGIAFRVRVRLVDPDADCKPLVGIPFEIWHADRIGEYSSFMGERGSMWLRGVQMTDETGLAEFVTIYPGSYPGRAIHIHFKAHVGNRVVTSQMYFPEDLSREIMARDEYAGFGAAITPNASDGVGRNDYEDLMVALQKDGDGYAGDLVIGIRMA